MGIKGLWSVLTPYSEKKSLHEIRGECIAVDLSGWICDSQNVTEYYIQPKMYLRNLFFRTIYLLLADINPIFVLEGDAPELKRDVMAARNAIQFKGAAPKSDAAVSRKPDIARKRFKGVLKECENLLKCMGVRCVKGRGEAEATCAQLNAQGLVDAVVSQDSDCFAYGARRVYRNFSVSSSAGGGAMAGSVDCYDADALYKSNGFGRKKMVALAILCGCDYGVGACGSSINTVLSFLHTVPDEEAIPRLLSWVSDPEHYEKQSRWVAVPGRCDRCGHAGRTHTKNGCPVCVTHKGCNDTGHKTKLSEVKRELSLRTRALSSGMHFPEPKVMKEFLHTPPETIDLHALKTPVPSLIQFVKLMSFKLDWTERYCVEKFLPLLTKWHLQEKVPCRTIKPSLIKKKRTPRGVPSYEVVWSDIDGQYEGLIPDDQYDEDEDKSKPWTSTERQDLMRQYFPELVESYEESIKKPVKEKKTRGRKKTDGQEGQSNEKPKRKYTKKVKSIIKNDVDHLSGSFKRLNISTKADNNTSKGNISVSVNKLKRKLKIKKQKTIDSFVKNKRRKSAKKLMDSLRQSFKNVSVQHDKVYDVDDLDYIDKAFDDMCNKENDQDNANDRVLSILNTTDEDYDYNDLSSVVNNIIQREPDIKTAKIDNKLYRLVFEKYSTPKKAKMSILNEIRNNCSTPTASPIRRPSFKYMADISNQSLDGFNNHCSNVSGDDFAKSETKCKRKCLTNNLNYSSNKSLLNYSITNRSCRNISATSKNVSDVKTSNQSIQNRDISIIPKVNTSYFFDKLTDDRDAFELSMEYKHKSAIISLVCDATVDYSLPDVQL